MDMLYSLLKITSMIATGVFGALGLLTKYKDDQGNITKWGKVALGGILISSGISLGLYILETSKAKASAIKAQAEAKATAQKLETILVNAQTTAEQQKRSLEETNILKVGLEKTLERSDYIAKGMENSLAAQQAVLSGNKEILGGVTSAVKKQGEVLNLATSTLKGTEQLLYPISSLQLRVHLTIPLETPRVPQYISRISGELDPLFKFLESNGNWKRTGEEQLAAMGLYTPMPGAIGIPANSPFYPSPATEGRTTDVFRVGWVELAFYRNPIDPTKFHPFSAITDEPNQADLRATLTSSPNQPLLLHYYGSKDDLQIRGDLNTNPEEWMLSNNILSIPELNEGGQLFISLGPQGRLISDEGNMDWFPERQHFYFTSLYLRISKREFVIRGKDLTQYQTSEGAPYWCYQFRQATTK